MSLCEWLRASWGWPGVWLWMASDCHRQRSVCLRALSSPRPLLFSTCHLEVWRLGGACPASPSPCCLAMKLWCVEPTSVRGKVRPRRGAPQEGGQVAAGVTSPVLFLHPRKEQDIPVLLLIYGETSPVRARWALVHS